MVSVMESKFFRQGNRESRLHLSERQSAILRDFGYDAGRLPRPYLYRSNPGADPVDGQGERQFSDKRQESGLRDAQAISATRREHDTGVHAFGSGEFRRGRAIRVLCESDNSGNGSQRIIAGAYPVPKGVVIVGEIHRSLAEPSKIQRRNRSGGGGSGMGGVRNSKIGRKGWVATMAVAACIIAAFAIPMCVKGQTCVGVVGLDLFQLTNLPIEKVCA